MKPLMEVKVELKMEHIKRWKWNQMPTHIAIYQLVAYSYSCLCFLATGAFNGNLSIIICFHVYY
ncbi:hypothetical protein Patl1_07409 [Pistacia atlantica]|uniref:Uncharacterized protein n=1 Tax=Pistacia atlantica TaxID=434234 RepID=A0ACC1AL39_9ROSI|nr:hypothetical protein Patl1_07409 [Pistacia atlantica]